MDKAKEKTVIGQQFVKLAESLIAGEITAPDFAEQVTDLAHTKSDKASEWEKIHIIDGLYDDVDLYEEDPCLRAESKSYYDDEGLIKRVKATLVKYKEELES